MKIFIFGDVHGNFDALKKISKTKDYKTADVRIFMGDAVTGCASPHKCVQLLNKLDCIKLIGNNDSYVAVGMPADEHFKQTKLDQLSFAKNEMSKADEAIIKSWKKEYIININNKILYFVHYPWESDDNVIDDVEKSLPARQQAFNNIKADYIFFAHEHDYSYFKDDCKHYYCISASGLSKDYCYTVINVDNNIIDIQEKRIEGNLPKEKQLVIQKYPECVGKTRIIEVFDWIINNT